MTLLSLVIPCLNEGERLPPLLDSLAHELEGLREPTVELIVADDGSSPSHLERERSAVENLHLRLQERQSAHRLTFRPLGTNGGKGKAIRAGWQAAHPQADWLGFLDGDGAIAACELRRCAQMLPDADFDVLAGSRIRMAGHQVLRSPVRHYQGRVFATVADLTLSLGFYDTQCGLKLARSSLLRPLLPRLREDGWLLDLELLHLLKQAGARMIEEPIDWHEPGGSKVRPVLDAARMLLGLGRLRLRHRQ
ncbi:MAG: glycosyltransferase [Myxococcales bacterium]|nr:glycosyltransferase [Myxococcales bacterium]